MASAPPTADTKKPVTPPPSKDGKGNGDKVNEAPGAAKGVSGIAASQRRFDRMAVRAKLAVSHPQDSAEKEADHVAQQVIHAARNTPSTANQTNDKKAQRASLEPVTTQKEQKAMALKPVPAAENIQRLAQPSDKKVQRESDDDGGSDSMAGATVDSSLEARIEAQRGGGSELPPAVAAEMAARFNRNFDVVRVHTNNEAADLCAETKARAFTIGADIFFAAGEFAPETDTGKELLAHELTHTIQQRNGLNRVLQREVAAGTDSEPKRESKTKITNLTLKVPLEYKEDFEKMAKPEVVHHKNYKRDKFGNNQREVWINGLKGKLGNSTGKLKQASGFKHNPDDKYIFEVPSRYAPPSVSKNDNNNSLWMIGSLNNCAEKMLIPEWDREGKPHKSAGNFSYDVDHKADLQFGAENKDSFSPRSEFTEFNNLRLLDADINRNKKNRFMENAMSEALKPLVMKENEKEAAKPDKKSKKKPLTPESVRKNTTLVFTTISGGNTLAKSKDDYWNASDIENGEHIQKLLDAKHIYARDVEFIEGKADDDQFIIFHSPTGGRKNTINLNQKSEYENLLKPFKLELLSAIKKSGGATQGNTPCLLRFKVSLPNGAVKGAIKSIPKAETLDIEKLNNSNRVGFFPREKWSLQMGLRKFVKGDSNSPLSKKGMSPISVDDWEITANKGMSITGQILPTLPLLGSTPVDFQLTGDDLTFSKTFNCGELSVPPPFRIDDCSLTVSASTSGQVQAAGQVDFGVDKLGDGYLQGIVGTNGLGAEGEFNFDSKLFDRATIKVWYREEQLGAEGVIGVDNPGKIRGIKSGNLNMKYEKGVFAADGIVTPDIPGIEQATLKATYSEADGLMMGGTAKLKPNPAIRSGSIDITVHKLGEDWKVSANGTAQPAIPGINSQLIVSYDEGAFTAEFSGAFQRGLISGNATVGTTNRALGADGRPTGAAVPNAPLVVYGNGSATIQVAPWLQGTAGIRFSPNGEVSVSGEIGLPSSLQIFPRKDINKQLLSLSTQIPVFPGIVAEVGGNLCASASIGPGALDQCRISIEYNPSHEENTRVTGDAHLNIPANAGLRLAARAGIGIGITGASATGGLEMGGTLGIAGAAEAGVHIDWMPNHGLQIDAEGYLHAEPKFKFDVSGYVHVGTVLFDIYDNRWELAAYELGSNMRLGVRFPIHYREGQPFNVSLNDVQFEVPNVDPPAMIRQLGNEIF